jgi:hypothetical protein
MIGTADDTMLKAFTGFEGGCVAGGSTCGVVTAGAMGIALKNEDRIHEAGEAAQREVIAQAGDYVKWFSETYGTCFCRHRTGCDFYTISGQLRYFLTGYILSRCFWHIRGAMRYLHARQTQEPGLLTGMPSRGTEQQPLHCARAVLAGIRKNTGLEDSRLEDLSFVFDGGIGLSGGLCGALIGAVIGVNLLLGLDIRNISFWKNVKAFTVGHVNLVVEKPVGAPEPFMAGREVVANFRKEAQSLECRSITGKRFAGWDDFQEFITGSSRCAQLIDMAVQEATTVIQRYQ